MAFAHYNAASDKNHHTHGRSTIASSPSWKSRPACPRNNELLSKKHSKESSNQFNQSKWDVYGSDRSCPSFTWPTWPRPRLKMACAVGQEPVRAWKDDPGPTETTRDGEVNKTILCILLPTSKTKQTKFLWISQKIWSMVTLLRPCTKACPSSLGAIGSSEAMPCQVTRWTSQGAVLHLQNSAKLEDGTALKKHARNEYELFIVMRQSPNLFNQPAKKIHNVERNMWMSTGSHLVLDLYWGSEGDELSNS